MFIVLVQGAIAIPSKGAWVLISLFGYWLIQIGALGFFNNFRDLIIKSPNYLSEKKFLHFLIVICFISLGHCLIHIGKFNILSILFLKIPVLVFALFMGIVEGALDKLKDEEI